MIQSTLEEILSARRGNLVKDTAFEPIARKKKIFNVDVCEGGG